MQIAFENISLSCHAHCALWVEHVRYFNYSLSYSLHTSSMTIWKTPVGRSSRSVFSVCVKHSNRSVIGTIYFSLSIRIVFWLWSLSHLLSVWWLVEKLKIHHKLGESEEMSRKNTNTWIQSSFTWECSRSVQYYVDSDSTPSIDRHSVECVIQLRTQNII